MRRRTAPDRRRARSAGRPGRRFAAVASLVAIAAAVGPLTACTAEQNGDAVTGIIPAPTSFVLHEGAPFRLTKSSRLVAAGEGASAVVETFARQARAATGFELPVVEGEPAVSDLAFVVADGESPDAAPEGYTLEVGDAGAGRGRLRGGTLPRHPVAAAARRRRSSGCRDGSRRRMDRARGIRRGRLRFAYRGAMLDVARHFFPLEDVLRYLDAIALVKLNVLHLHLTDDQGWRIRIDSWPELTGVGASTSVGGDGGGSYTKGDYRRIVEYAAERFITIVPEIDLPGHTNAALSAYPELNPRRRRTRAVRGRRGRLLVAVRLARASRGDRPVPGRRHARARRATPGPWPHSAATSRSRRVATTTSTSCGGSPWPPPRPARRSSGGIERAPRGAARRHRGAVLELRRARGRCAGSPACSSSRAAA